MIEYKHKKGDSHVFVLTDKLTRKVAPDSLRTDEALLWSRAIISSSLDSTFLTRKASLI